MPDADKPNLKLLDAGDAGLVVQLGEGLDPSINAAVIALADALVRRAEAGVVEVIPTYRSLLIQFDPLQTSKASLAGVVAEAWRVLRVEARQATLWHLPVCYGGKCGMDLAAVAEAHDMDESEVVSRHAAATYRIYMIGFAPGFAYLGGLDPALHTSRRKEPRLETPPRSISIGGMQAAVAPPIAIPSGWHMLGQTPVRSYDLARSERPFLFSAGDFVRFHPVSVAEYRRQLAATEAGEAVEHCEVIRG